MFKASHVFLVAMVTISTLFTEAEAAYSPLAFGIAPPVQFPGEEHSVAGFRFSLIYGKSKNVNGIDLGLIGNITEQTFRGSAVSGLFNWNQGAATVVGVQLAGITNINKYYTNVYGIQASLIANLGPTTDIYGVQLGIYNRAREVYGLQIGLFNYCQNLHGIQIGLANFNAKGLFGVTPLINIGF